MVPAIPGAGEGAVGVFLGRASARAGYVAACSRRWFIFYGLRITRRQTDLTTGRVAESTQTTWFPRGITSGVPSRSSRRRRGARAGAQLFDSALCRVRQDGSNGLTACTGAGAGLHTDTGEKVFDNVLVISDRQVLDRQLQDAVDQLTTTTGTFQPITLGRGFQTDQVFDALAADTTIGSRCKPFRGAALQKVRDEGGRVAGCRSA